MESTIMLWVVAFVSLVFLMTKKRIGQRRVPPGSLGIPIIGQTVELSKAMQADTGEEWLQQRARKYGPISKMNIFGKRTVFVTGQAYNKFIYTSDEQTLSNKQPASVRRMVGERNLFEMSGQDHRRLRGAILSFLKPEALKQYVGTMDHEIRLHLAQHWHHDHVITEIEDNCAVAMIAGHDSTSTLLTFLIKLIAEHPNVYEVLHSEHEEIVRGKKRASDPLTWEDIGKMKYTWRVATEALRMYPPALIGFRQVLQDIEIGGYVIPKRWQVIWAGCMTQLDGSIYPDPHKFDPSRFENQAAMPPHTFIAFGGGSRICPGYEFAKLETLAMIHYLVTRFTWKLCMKQNTISRDPLPVFKQGLPIHITSTTLYKT